MQLFKGNDEKVFLNDAFDLIDAYRGVQSGIFSGLPKPDNVIDWAVSPKFLNFPVIYTNRGQYYALREFFQCYCPICSPFSSEEVMELDTETLKKDVLLVYDWEKHVEFCPRCGSTKAELMKDKLLTPYNSAIGVIGMRAGKTTFAAIAMTFMEAFLICTGGAKSYLGVPSAPFIEIGCVAVSKEQAKDTIWAQFLKLRDDSPWFGEFKEIIYENNYEKEKLYVETGSVITNEIIGLHIKSLHSASGSMAGRTRTFFVVDEIGKFDTTESKRSASEVWRMGSHSLKTVRKQVTEKNLPNWFGSILGIGSPHSIDDFGMKMFNKEGSEAVFKMKFATWQFNKEYTEGDFKEEFADDWVGATRDFGANPPGAETPFIEDWKTTLDLCEDTGASPVILFANTERFGRMSHIKDQITFLGKKVAHHGLDRDEHVLACDAGARRDSFAMVGCKRVWKGNTYEMHQTFALHILPNGPKLRYVDYECIVPLIQDIAKVVSLKRICFDYWNSEFVVQKLSGLGMPVEFYPMAATKLQDFYSFKEALNLGQIYLLPRVGSEDGDPVEMDTTTRQYWEMKRMQRSKDLKKVDHSTTSTSDIFECVVNCWRMLNELLSTQSIPSGESEGSARNFGGVVHGRW